MCKRKLLISLVFTLFCLFVSAQEQKEIVLKTEVSEATVFINGAQILRKKGVDLLPGKTKIRFTNLSPYIDAKSVQIKMDGDAMVVSVNHQSGFIDSLKKPLATKTNGKMLNEIFDKILMISIDKNIQLDRLMKRNNLSKEDALSRINVQLSEDLKRDKSDYIIENNSTIDDFTNKIKSFIEALD